MRAGTGLMAGAPTGNPRPGSVTRPTPGPAWSSTVPAGAPVGSQAAVTVTCAPWVTSGSSPASLTTAARPGKPGRPASVSVTPKLTRRPSGSPTSTSAGGVRESKPTTAALAAAEAHVPVVQPVRSPFARATSGAIGGSWAAFVTVAGPTADRPLCRRTTAAGTQSRGRESTGGTGGRRAALRAPRRRGPAR